MLRFPEFDVEWRKMSFGNLFSFRTTNSFLRDQLNYEEGVVKNIHYGEIHTKFSTLFDVTNEEAILIIMFHFTASLMGTTAKKVMLFLPIMP